MEYPKSGNLGNLRDKGRFYILQNMQMAIFLQPAVLASLMLN